MKNVFIVICVLLFEGTLCAQSVTPVVICSAGDFFLASQGSLSWTLGEFMVETYQKTEGSLSQGFQQPSPGLVTGLKDVEAGISLYPNPVHDHLTVRLGRPDEHIIEVFDMKGNRLFNYAGSTMDSTVEIKVDMNDFAPALYLVRITQMTSASTISYRIEKY